MASGSSLTDGTDAGRQPPDHFQDTAGIRLCPGLHGDDLNIDQLIRSELVTQDRQPPRIDRSMVGQAIGSDFSAWSSARA